MTDRPETPLLDTVKLPADLRALTKDQLLHLAEDLELELFFSLFSALLAHSR